MNNQMHTIQQILEKYGYESVADMDLNESITVDGGPGFMDLTIEKVGETQISVAHYYEQNHDLMRDPEIVFEVDGNAWIPIEYTHDPYVYQRDVHGLGGAADFAKQWNRRLKKQGYLDRAGDTEVNA